jgi:Predicted membrane protein (DUF2207) N-terminal domain
MLKLLADGSVQVTERFDVQFDSPRTTFRRVSPPGEHDGVFDIGGSMDGVTFAPGKGPKRLAATAGDHLDAEWHFAETTGPHAFILSYRAAGVVHVSGIRGRVSWAALPASRDLKVDAAVISLSLPQGAIQLQDPWVMQAGWDVVKEPYGVHASRKHVPPGEGATIGAEFTIDTMAIGQPVWQYHESRADEFKLAFLSAGVFILIVGVGVIAMVMLRHSRGEVAKAGAADSDRAAVAHGLRRAGVVSILAGAAGWPLVSFTLGSYGAWPYALPICTGISGVLFVWYGRRMGAVPPPYL